MPSSCRFTSCVVVFVLAILLVVSPASGYRLLKSSTVGAPDQQAKGALTKEIVMEMPAGTCFFALPGIPASEWSASLLDEEMRKNGGALVSLKKVNLEGAFEEYVPHGASDFDLKPGCGYLLTNSVSCSVQVRLVEARNVHTLNLLKGVNIISVPIGGPYTAASLLAALQKQGTGSCYVAGLRDDRVSLYYPALSTPDFPIERGRGYLVASTKNTIWIPQFSPKSADEIPGGNSAAKSEDVLALETAIYKQLHSAKENRSPILLKAGERRVKIGEVIEGALIGFDLDGDTLHYSASPRQEGLSVDPETGKYRWDFSRLQNGRYTVEFQVADGKETAVQTGTFIVVPDGE